VVDVGCRNTVFSAEAKGARSGADVRSKVGTVRLLEVLRAES